MRIHDGVMFSMKKRCACLSGIKALIPFMAVLFFPAAVQAGGNTSFRDPETGITVIRPKKENLPGIPSGNGYMTGRELDAMYGKTIEKNLPYDLKLGTVDEVTFSEEGDVTAHMTLAEVYQFMPSSVKKRMEAEYYNNAKTRYCRSVVNGKHNLHRIKSLSIEAYTVYGELYKKYSVTPLMCQTHKD